jgi:hypothetical protein
MKQNFVQEQNGARSGSSFLGFQSARCTVTDLLSTFTSLYNGRVREMCEWAGRLSVETAQTVECTRCY